MKPIHKEVIKAMCDCDMIMYRAAQIMYVAPGTVIYHVKQIEEIYGLSPRKYRDLVKLERMAEEEPDTVDIKRYCIHCNQEITNPRNRKFCSKKCSNQYFGELYKIPKEMRGR